MARLLLTASVARGVHAMMPVVMRMVRRVCDEEDNEKEPGAPQ